MYPEAGTLQSEVWKFLTQASDSDGLVKVSKYQIAVGAGYLDGSRDWNANAKNRIRLILGFLQQRGVLQLVAPPSERGAAATYQLLHLWRPKPDRRQPPCRDPWILAFEERAASWAAERQRVWRPVWLAVIASADRRGHFRGEIAGFADSATERLGALVTDETVARILKWSVDAGLTEEVFCGHPSEYRIRIPRDNQPARTRPEAIVR